MPLYKKISAKRQLDKLWQEDISPLYVMINYLMNNFMTIQLK